MADNAQIEKGAGVQQRLVFKFLPSYADFLLKNKIREFTAESLRLAFASDLPILKHFDLSAYTQEQLLEMSIPAYVDFLTHMSQNKLGLFIDEALKKWITNQLPAISRDQLVVKDITLATYLRKQALYNFIPAYTSNAQTAIELVRELEDYGLEAVSLSFTHYIDIHQQKLQEVNRELQRNESLYKQAERLAHIGNWSWSVGSGEVFWSDELYRIYGLEPQSEMISLERFINFIHPLDRVRIQREIENILTTGRVGDYRMRIVIADNTTKVLQGKGEGLQDENGKLYKIIGTCQDITREEGMQAELKNREENLAGLNASLEEKNNELKRSNDELTSFSYVASHDLQEPLRKIKTFSDLLVSKDLTNLSAEGKNYVDKISASTLRMQKLILDLLAYSRTQVYNDSKDDVDLNQVIANIKNSYEDSLQKGGLIIEADHLPIVKGVSFQLQQLFENLISNSVKYSRPGIPVKVAIGASAAIGKKVPAGSRFKKYYKISVIDNGIGFEQVHAKKIFEIFQRLHSKAEYSGTGIGLAICKKIVENHNGFITASAKPGEGAEFDVYLPDMSSAIGPKGQPDLKHN